MIDIADIAAIKDYLKKIQRVVTMDVDFNLFGTRLIKREKIDNLLCCVLAKLPKEYQKLMREGVSKRYSSVLSLSALQKELSKTFWLNKNYYSVDLNVVNKLTISILSSIQHDLEAMEQNL